MVLQGLPQTAQLPSVEHVWQVACSRGQSWWLHSHPARHTPADVQEVFARTTFQPETQVGINFMLVTFANWFLVRAVATHGPPSCSDSQRSMYICSSSLGTAAHIDAGP